MTASGQDARRTGECPVSGMVTMAARDPKRTLQLGRALGHIAGAADLRTHSTEFDGSGERQRTPTPRARFDFVEPRRVFALVWHEHTIL